MPNGLIRLNGVYNPLAIPLLNGWTRCVSVYLSMFVCARMCAGARVHMCVYVCVCVLLMCRSSMMVIVVMTVLGNCWR